MVSGGRSCCVIGCQNRSALHKDKHFYRFPPESPLREIWTTFTRRGHDYELKKSSVICQDHFGASCFVNKKKQVCLAKNTIPTIFYRTTAEGEEKIELTFDYDVMHYVEEDTLLNPVYDREKHEAELMAKKERKLKEISRMCRYCLEDQNEENLIEVSKLREYSINPNEVLTLVGLNPQYNDLFSKYACEDCFQQIFVFDGYRKRCQRAQDRLAAEVKLLDQQIQKVCGNSGQGLWLKTETSTNWNDDDDEEEHYLNDSSGSSPVKQSAVVANKPEFQRIIVKEEREDEISDDDMYQDFVPSVAMNETTGNDVDEEILLPTKTEDDEEEYIMDATVAVEALKTMTRYETDTFDLKDVFMPERYQGSNCRFYECFYCRLKYAGKVTFNKHACAVREIKCEFPGCLKVFTKLSGFNSHITKLHKLPKIKRQYCSFCKLSKATTEELFKEHNKRCEKNAKLNVDIPVTCDLCGKTCPNQRTFSIHMMFHTTGNKSFNYDESEEPNPADPNGKPKYKKRPRGIFICETCGKEFATKRYLSDHTRRVHTVMKNPAILTCDHCGKTRTTRYALSKHIRNVHIVAPSPCPECGKVFRNRPLLQAHMIYHKDYKRIHFCPLCPDKPPYVTAVALKRHQESNHGYGNGYHCDICDAVYKTRPGLSQHKLSAHTSGYGMTSSLQRYF